MRVVNADSNQPVYSMGMHILGGHEMLSKIECLVHIGSVLEVYLQR